MITAREALERLREGNSRFLNEDPDRHTLNSRTHCSELAADQEPFAIVLGCSDSRVSPEIIFDQGLGDLFVIRVAGNIAEPSQIGSIEFAAEYFGTRLVVVLGHTGCGAVIGTLDFIQGRMEKPSSSLHSILESIGSTVAPLLETELRNHPDELLSQACRANIVAEAKRLRQDSPVMGPLIEKGQLLVVGAEYSLETGVVDFFDGLPRS